jgi:hypothetical protein
MNKPVRPNDLYASDYALWLDRQVAALERGDIAGLDLTNLAEEVGDLGRSERFELSSNLVVVLAHLLKWRYQPTKRKKGWSASIREHRRRIRKRLDRSPSLKPSLREVLIEDYADARALAAIETGLAIEVFPETCPFAIEHIIDPDWLPDAR